MNTRRRRIRRTTQGSFSHLWPFCMIESLFLSLRRFCSSCYCYCPWFRRCSSSCKLSSSLVWYTTLCLCEWDSNSANKLNKFCFSTMFAHIKKLLWFLSISAHQFQSERRPKFQLALSLQIQTLGQPTIYFDSQFHRMCFLFFLWIFQWTC